MIDDNKLSENNKGIENNKTIENEKRHHVDDEDANYEKNDYKDDDGVCSNYEVERKKNNWEEDNNYDSYEEGISNSEEN